jgi:hypothetical protein
LAEIYDVVVKVLGAIAAIAGATAALMKLVPPKSWKLGKRRLRKGDRIEVRSGTDGEWYPASVEGRFSDGQLEIRYDNGTKELVDTPHKIRSGININTQVKVLYRGRSYLGTVVGFDPEGGYNVKFEDGEVCQEWARNVEDPNQPRTLAAP